MTYVGKVGELVLPRTPCLCSCLPPTVMSHVANNINKRSELKWIIIT
jgi:hypothetical protein